MRDEELQAKALAIFTATFDLCRGEVQGHEADRPLTPAELDLVEPRAFRMLRALSEASAEFPDGMSTGVSRAIDYAEAFFEAARQSNGRITAPDETARFH